MGKKIGLVTAPFGAAGLIPVSNMIDVLLEISPDLSIINGNEVNALAHSKFKFLPCRDRSIVFATLCYLYGQLLTGSQLFKESKHVHTWIFFFGGERMILPILLAKCLRKHVTICCTGSTVKSAEFSKNPFLVPVTILANICFSLANNIVLYSSTLIDGWGLERYRHKILIAHEHFLDFETFTVTTPLADRSPLIGYIGRLSGEKGVQHFAQALPAILSDRRDLRVLIGGDGDLKEAVEACLQEQGVTTRVDLPGWISHDDLPGYLNQLRLLVLPSYTEGLPNIML